MCLALTPGHVFLPHFLGLCVSLKQQNTDTYRKRKEKKIMHTCSLLSLSWRQTQTHPVRLSRSIIHSLQRLIQSVSAGPWDCYCSLLLSSSLSSSLLASVLLSQSHLPGSGDRQRHDWSAEVVDATSFQRGLWWCRTQRCVVLSIDSF